MRFSKEHTPLPPEDESGIRIAIYDDRPALYTHTGGAVTARFSVVRRWAEKRWQEVADATVVYGLSFTRQECLKFADNWSRLRGPWK